VKPHPVPKIERVLILGHSGFIGNHLIETWRQHPGGVEVKGISISELDLTQEKAQETITEAYDDHTAVVLCAAVKRQFGDNASAFESNVRIVQNLIAAAGRKKISRLAFMSSAAVYGEETHDTAITEETSVNPSSYYGIAKFTGECLLRKALGEGKITSLICFRPPLVYGPGDRGKTYGPSGFCAAAREKSPITLWGDGSELREFIYLEDLGRMIRHLTLGDFQGAVNLVSGISYSFKDVLSCLEEVCPNLLPIQKRERSKEKVDNAFRPSLIRSLLMPKFEFTPLLEGIRKTFQASS